MKSKALWVGLLAVGVADWLLLNVVVGPAYLGSADKPAMASTPERAPVAAASPAQPHTPTPETTVEPGGPSVPSDSEPAVDPPVPSGSEPAVDPPVPGDSEPTVAPPVPSDSEPVSPEPSDVAAHSTPLPSTEPLLFARQSAELGEDARRSLKNVSKYLLENPDATVVIEGHADRRGKDEFNVWLSLQRARAARAYLHALGIRMEQMRIEARGSSDPIDSSGSEAARAKNRRVELIVK